MKNYAGKTIITWSLFIQFASMHIYTIDKRIGKGSKIPDTNVLRRKTPSWQKKTKKFSTDFNGCKKMRYDCDVASDSRYLNIATVEIKLKEAAMKHQCKNHQL